MLRALRDELMNPAGLRTWCTGGMGALVCNQSFVCARNVPGDVQCWLLTGDRVVRGSVRKQLSSGMSGSSSQSSCWKWIKEFCHPVLKGFDDTQITA